MAKRPIDSPDVLISVFTPGSLLLASLSDGVVPVRVAELLSPLARYPDRAQSITHFYESLPQIGPSPRVLVEIVGCPSLAYMLVGVTRLYVPQRWGSVFGPQRTSLFKGHNRELLLISCLQSLTLALSQANTRVPIRPSGPIAPPLGDITVSAGPTAEATRFIEYGSAYFIDRDQKHFTIFSRGDGLLLELNAQQKQRTGVTVLVQAIVGLFQPPPQSAAVAILANVILGSRVIVPSFPILLDWAIIRSLKHVSISQIGSGARIQLNMCQPGSRRFVKLLKPAELTTIRPPPPESGRNPSLGNILTYQVGLQLLSQFFAAPQPEEDGNIALQKAPLSQLPYETQFIPMQQLSRLAMLGAATFSRDRLSIPDTIIHMDYMPRQVDAIYLPSPLTEAKNTLATLLGRAFPFTMTPEEVTNEVESIVEQWRPIDFPLMHAAAAPGDTSGLRQLRSVCSASRMMATAVSDPAAIITEPEPATSLAKPARVYGGENDIITRAEGAERFFTDKQTSLNVWPPLTRRSFHFNPLAVQRPASELAAFGATVSRSAAAGVPVFEEEIEAIRRYFDDGRTVEPTAYGFLLGGSKERQNKCTAVHEELTRLQMIKRRIVGVLNRLPQSRRSAQTPMTESPHALVSGVALIEGQRLHSATARAIVGRELITQQRTSCTRAVYEARSRAYSARSLAAAMQATDIALDELIRQRQKYRDELKALEEQTLQPASQSDEPRRDPSEILPTAETIAEELALIDSRQKQLQEIVKECINTEQT